jgi:hypothetical protein
VPAKNVGADETMIVKAANVAATLTVITSSDQSPEGATPLAIKPIEDLEWSWWNNPFDNSRDLHQRDIALSVGIRASVRLQELQRWKLHTARLWCNNTDGGGAAANDK